MMTPPLAAKETPVHLLLLKDYPILEQLRLEEALLRADSRNWCLLNVGSPPAIVMGISGRPELLIDTIRMNLRPVPVIRRFSGGGTVFVDENTIFVSWICNTACSGVQCSPAGAHGWAERFFEYSLPMTGMRLRENDYVIGDRKFGGNAQYMRKQRWLHHSSLLWDYDPSNMEYLLIPAKMPQYRQQRCHDDFLCRLRDYVATQDTLMNLLLDGLNRQFEVHEVPIEEALKVIVREHRQATTLIK